MTTDPEVSPLRKALLAVAVPVALAAAVIIQLTMVNRLPLPADVQPDLVLLLVAAIGVTTTPMAGMLAGFAGGLALDTAPPATHYAGEYALVFCLTGFAAGWAMTVVVNATGERAPATALSAMAAAAACGEAGKAALGLLLSDPHVTGPAIGHVLPGAILADLLLSPLVLALVRRAVGDREPERAPRPESTHAQRSASAFRPAAAGAVPDLRLAGTGTVLPGAQPPPRREPRLRLRGTRSPALTQTNAASSPIAQPLLAGGRAARLNLAGSRSASSFRTGGSAVGPSLFPGPAAGTGRVMPPKGWLRPARLAAVPAVRRSSPGKGWVRAGGSAALARPAAGPRRRASAPKFRAAASLAPAGEPGSRARAVRARRARGRRGPARGWLRASPSVAAVVSPAVRRGPGRGWLRASPSVAAVVSPAVRRGPGRGWLRASPSAASPPPPAVRRGPGRGWLRASPSAASPPPPAVRRSPGKGWLRVSRLPRRDWRASAPSSRWVRRSRARARWRARLRLLPLSRVLGRLPIGGRR